MKGMNIIIKTSFAFILGKPFDSTYPIFCYYVLQWNSFFMITSKQCSWLFILRQTCICVSPCCSTKASRWLSSDYHECVCLYVCVCERVFVCVCVCVCVFVCVCVNACVCVYFLCMCICVCTCVYLWECVCGRQFCTLSMIFQEIWEKLQPWECRSEKCKMAAMTSSNSHFF